MTPVKQKEEDQSKVTPTKTSPCKVDNEAVAKEAKGAPTVEKAKVPKPKAKAGTKDTSKADHGGDNATEAGVAPKRKASNGAADSEAPKKRPAAKGHRSRARIPVPATANEATTMEVEPKLENQSWNQRFLEMHLEPLDPNLLELILKCLKFLQLLKCLERQCQC